MELFSIRIQRTFQLVSTAEDLLATFMSGAKIETVCFITVSILAFRQLYRTQERPPFPKFAKTPTDFAHRAKM